LGRNLTMEQHEQERFDQLYAQHLQALTLQGKRGKTIDGYARAVCRIAGFFNRCPDNLTAADLKTYFTWMVENYSWSSVKVDLWGLSFFFRQVLGQPMEWVDIIKPPITARPSGAACDPPSPILFLNFVRVFQHVNVIAKRGFFHMATTLPQSTLHSSDNHLPSRIFYWRRRRRGRHSSRRDPRRGRALRRRARLSAARRVVQPDRQVVASRRAGPERPVQSNWQAEDHHNRDLNFHPDSDQRGRASDFQVASAADRQGDQPPASRPFALAGGQYASIAPGRLSELLNESARQPKRN